MTEPDDIRAAVKSIEACLADGLAAKGPDEDFEAFVRVSETDAGNFVGSVHAYTSHGWLAIDVLAVAKQHQKQGVGGQLLRAAEDWGRSRGCSHAKLETFYEEAFFEHHGYTTYALLNDYPPGGAFRYMSKIL